MNEDQTNLFDPTPYVDPSKQRPPRRVPEPKRSTISDSRPWVVLATRSGPLADVHIERRNADHLGVTTAICGKRGRVLDRIGPGREIYPCPKCDAEGGES